MLETVRLYQIPWSHFCEKVRWTLDLKNVPYECVTYNTSGPTAGLERAPTHMMKLTPIIEDPNNKTEHPYFLSDSTPIIMYLDVSYPCSFTLFPSADKQLILDTCLQLDSELGPYVRRLIYVQILGEYPRVLCLTQGVNHAWAYNPDDIRSRLVARFVACFMIARFRLHRILDDRVREKTEELLERFAAQLETKSYLVANQFTAADLTFCSLFKPLALVPYFRDHPRFQHLFDYHDRIRCEHDLKYAENINLIEKFIDKHRERTKEVTMVSKIVAFVRKINIFQYAFVWMMHHLVSVIYGASSDEQQPAEFPSQDRTATNDQRNLNIQSKFRLVPFIIKYNCHRCYTLPRQVTYLNGDVG
jgi:glutathione S-transferase